MSAPARGRDSERDEGRTADWLSVAEARERILATVAPLGAGRCRIEDVLGRVLAEDVAAPLNIPRRDNSAMDGFAVRAGDIRDATESGPRTLRVVDYVPAGGDTSRPVGPGEAARIMTGAPVPDGADSVVRVEHTDGGSDSNGGGAEGTSGAGEVRIFSDRDANSNIRTRGEDLREGDSVLRTGTVLRAAEVGLLASIGVSEPAVVKRPRVAVLASGDELVEIDAFEREVLGGSRIVSTNSYSLGAQLAESGIESRSLGIAADSPESLRDRLADARASDALITTGGISVGDRDHTWDVLAGFGLRDAFWRVRMRPGSPFAFGRVEGLGGIPWFGLPGNPVSAMVTFEVFVRPALLRIAGRTAIFPRTVRARLRDDYAPKPGLTHFPRVKLERERGKDAEEAWWASLTGPQGSGILTSMAAADALLVMPEGRTDGRAGDVYTAFPIGGERLHTDPG